jgi:hypothetical protein
MSENTVQVPAHIAARIAARQGQDKNSLMGAIVNNDFAYPKISTKGSRFRLVEDGVETVVGVTMDVVIVGANPRVSKIFYARQYDPKDVSPPDCFSDDGIVPDSSVTDPVHSNCESCPNNILGSKINPGTGAKTKLCGDQRHLAVVSAADPSKVYGLSVPVSGMKALREYFKGLNNYGLIPQEVITELSFDDDASYPKLLFSQKGYVPAKGLVAIEEIEKSPEVNVVTRQRDDTNKLAAPATPKAAPVAEKPAVAAAAVVVDEDEEDTTPTVAKTPAKTAKAKPAPAETVEAETVQAEAAPAKAAAAEPVTIDNGDAGDPVPANSMSALEKKLGSIFTDDDD